jgi:hypothetical protein
MAKAASRLGIVVVVIAIGLVVVCAIAWYDFVWVASQKRYFNERNFRVLKTLSTQIQSKIDGYDKIMDHALDSCDGKGPACKKNLGEIFRTLCPDLRYVSEDDREEEHASVDMLPPDDPPVLQIKRDQGRVFLYLALQRGHSEAEKVDIVTKADVSEIVKPLIEPLLNDRLFDAVVLARADGRVIFQQGSSSLQFDRISGLVDRKKQTTKERSERKKEEVDASINLAALPQSSGLAEVNLGETDYKLYSQPIQLSYYSYEAHARARGNKPQAGIATGSEPSGADTRTGSEYEAWILCGLVQSSHFRADSLAISFNYVLGVSLVVLLLFFSLPFLKLQLMNPRERLHSKDGVFLAISVFFLTGLLTFLLLDLYYYAYEFHDEADQELRRFAEEMNRHFREEEDKVWDQLTYFEKSAGFREALRFIQDHQPEKQKSTRREPDGEIACSNLLRAPFADKLSACSQTDLLSDKSRFWIQHGPDRNGEGTSNPEQLPRWRYPYFQSASWYDEDGWQRIKWDFRGTPTPFLNLATSKIPYYLETKRQIRWWKDEKGQKPLPRGIYPRYSVTTGQNIVVFWRLEPKENGPLAAGAIATRPLSLIQPVLPGHLEFAVIDKDGKVLFHSDPTLNLRENFLQECDMNSKLHSLIASGTSDTLTANYRGRGHHLYVTRLGSASSLLENGPWTLVVFRDMDIQETMNFEVITLSTILFILYAGLLGVLSVFIFLIFPRSPYPNEWFWPNETKGGAYRRIMIFNAVLFVVCFLLTHWFEQLGTVCLVLVLIILLPIPIHYAMLEKDVLQEQKWASGLELITNSFKGARQAGWRAAYFGARVSLLLLIVVLPCFLFFKTAYNLEKKLLIERGQLSLANRLEERKQTLRKAYEKIELGTTERDILAEPKADRDNQLWAYHAVLETTIDETPCERDRTRETVQSAVERKLNRFFSRIRPLYNYVAEETHGLIANSDRPDHETGLWETDRTHKPPGLVLRRHRKREPDRDLVVRSEWNPLKVPWGNGLWWLEWGLFLPVLYLLVRYGSGELLFIDPNPPPSFKSTDLVDLLDNKEVEDFPSYTLIVGPPNSGKTAQLKSLTELMERIKEAGAVFARRQKA